MAFSACSLQDLNHLRDDSLFLPDAGQSGAGNVSGNGGLGNAGASGSPGGSSGAAGTPAGGDGGAAGSSASGTGGVSGSNGSGTGGVGGSSGASTGGVGGAAGFVGTIGDAGPDMNIVVDPGFESGLSTWVAFGSTVLMWETSGPLAGTRCLRSTIRDAAWAGPSYSLTNGLTAGATYRVSAWVRTGSPVQPMKISTRFTCSGDLETTFQELFSPVAAYNYWEHYEAEFVAPTCALDTFDVYVEGPPAGEDLFIDEFRVELIAEPPP